MKKSNNISKVKKDKPTNVCNLCGKKVMYEPKMACDQCKRIVRKRFKL